MKRLFLLLGLFAASLTPCAADERIQKRELGTLTVRFDAATPKLALADLITVTLTIEGRKGLRVKAPDRFPLDFPWVLVESSKVSRTALAPDRDSWRLVYRFAPRAPGKKIDFKFPDVQVRETQEASEEQSIKWDPIAFEVVTAITSPDRSGLRDINGPEITPPDPPEEPFDWTWPLATCVIVLILMLALGVRGLLRRRSLRTPAQLALYEWRRLVALKLPEQGRSERFITLLTLLMRQYLERQFAIPARRQTTPEFLAGLEKHSLLSSDEKQFLTSFLQQSEAVKFAQSEMSAEDCRHWAEAALAFLQRRANA